MIIAHRGASAEAPENTLEAFELAWRQNADAIEGDFHLTKDREIVCHHDPGIRGRPISHLNLEEIRDLKPEVPTLGEVLNTVPPGKHSILEIKSGPETVPALMNRLADYDAEKITVISFHSAVIQAVKQSRQSVQANWLVKFQRPIHLRLRPGLKEVLHELKRIQADGLGTHPQHISPHIVRKLNAAGFAHHVWTVDDPEQAARFLSWGTASITTNRPGEMKRALAEHHGAIEQSPRV